MPKISVIVPVYNYGRYLRQALESVLAQQFDDFEIIVVNDNSTDNTAEVLKEFEGHPKIRLITHDENRGLAPSCHEAIAASGGEYDDAAPAIRELVEEKRRHLKPDTAGSGGAG